MSLQLTIVTNAEMNLLRVGVLHKWVEECRDQFHTTDQDSRIILEHPCITTFYVYRRPPPKIDIKMPSISSIIVAAAALLSISAPFAAAKKDCREGTYYCGKDLLAIGNLLELVDTNAAS